jgi:hypothetical protein
MRRAWTTDELREMSQLLAKPPYPPFLIDNLRAALNYAADIMDAADIAINEGESHG